MTISRDLADLVPTLKEQDGNIGIGSTSPSTYGDAGTGGRNVIIQSTGTGRGVLGFVSETTGGADELLGRINFIDSDSTNTAYRGAAIDGIRGADANSAFLRFNTANSGNGTERMRITAAGKIGIGATSPVGMIDVVQQTETGSAGINVFRNSTATYLGIAYNSARDAFEFDSTYGATGAYKPIVFRTSDVERARITSGGFFKATNTGSYFSSADYHELRSDKSNTNSLLVTNSSTSGYGIEVKLNNENTTNIGLAVASTSANRDNFYVYSNGNVVNRNNSYGSLSDEKLKQDIVDASSAWDDVKGYRIRKYREKSSVSLYGEDAPVLLGVVAQELEQVSPGLIDEHPDFEDVTKTREVEKTREFEVTPAVLDEEGNIVEPAVTMTEIYTDIEEYTERVATGTSTKSVKYSILYMKAVKALQEAQVRIESLEAQNATFEARLAALEAK